VVAHEPQSFEPSPRPPAVSTDLPYAYAYTTRDDVAQYWRLPTIEEEGAIAALFSELRSAEELLAEQRAVTASATTTPDAGPADAASGPGESETPQEAEPEEPEPSPADAVEAPPPPGQEEEVGDEEQDDDSDDDPLPDHVRMRMLKGFYVALDQEERTDVGRRFYRTVRGAYVRASEVTRNTPPRSRGVVLGDSWRLPIAIAWRTGVHRYRLGPTSGRMIDEGTVARHSAYVVEDDDFVQRGRRYVSVSHGWYLRQPAVRVIHEVARPSRIPPGSQWIHVDLSQQSLVAYEGETPVFATLVSTGKEGFETPTGVFRIQSKHVSTTMDDDDNPEGAYSIEAVPWTMYFHGNFALHGAFWHYTFGRERSHGCVNLAPADARWLFQWTTPTLPAAWHGMFADRGRPGTFVYIED
jgi:hypothetical protein